MTVEADLPFEMDEEQVKNFLKVLEPSMRLEMAKMNQRVVEFIPVEKSYKLSH